MMNFEASGSSVETVEDLDDRDQTEKSGEYPIPENAGSRVRRNRNLENHMNHAAEMLLRGEI